MGFVDTTKIWRRGGKGKNTGGKAGNRKKKHNRKGQKITKGDPILRSYLESKVGCPHGREDRGRVEKKEDG